MLELKKVYAGYGQIEILYGVDIDVKNGEIVALIGPNGAGKSTVIKSVFNITNVTSGEISFNGKSIRDFKTHQLMEIGVSYVPQGRVNFLNMTVRENLMIGVDRISDKEVLEKRLENVYNTFPSLRRKENDLAYGLSGGEQQMLAVGRALMQEPKLLLLDEPTLGLSPKLQKELFSVIVGLREKGISMLIVEQNAKRVIEIADRTYLLENGKVVLSAGKDIINNKKIKETYLGAL